MGAPILPSLSPTRDLRSRSQSEGGCMRIKKHEKTYIVELEDGSSWRIWPGDLAIPLLWMPSTRLAVSEINGECWTHVLIDRLHGTCVRVIEAAGWAPQEIEASLVG